MNFTFLEATRIGSMITRCLIKDDDGFFYYATFYRSVAGCKQISSEELQRRLKGKGFGPEKLWPDCAEEWQEAESDAETDPALFIKRPFLLDDVSFIDYPDYHPGLITKEVTVCEVLRKTPHPNLAAYHGVLTDASDRVIGIAYTRYDSDLLDFVSTGKPFSTEHIISSVRAAVNHLHSLGLVHCDIRPPNIFIKGEGESMQVVLGDFDATYRLGEKISSKFGSAPFWPVDYKAGMEVKFEIDDIMLSNVKTWLGHQVKYQGRIVRALRFCDPRPKG